MSELTGTWFLVRFTLRRDLARTLGWMVGIVALVLLTAASIKGLFPTQADLDQAAAASAANAAAIAFNGPVQGLDTIGGEVAFQAGTFGLILVALMSLFTVTRYTRAEEESGRTELLRAAVLGRHSQTAAALVLVTGMNLILGSAVAVGLIAQGLPTPGSVSFGASFVAIGAVFTALTLVTTQITQNSRVASAASGIVLGYAFVIRAVGDIHGGHLSWLSPIGWSQKPRPYAGEQWWPFVFPVVATIALLVVAGALTAHRDWGAGLIQPRPGPARATPFLGRPLGLALRLDRVALMAWTGALLVLGFVYGAIANDINAFVAGNQTLEKALAAAGGANLVDAYFGTAMLILALIACCYPIQLIQRLRAEETTLRTETILATPTSRWRWIGSHLILGCGGSVVVMTAAGLGAGVPYAIEIGDARQVPTLIGAALVYLPAIWLLTGLSALAYGLAPRALPAAWIALTACFVIGFLGEILKPPHWLIQLSPFQHTPQLPAATLSLTPLIAQTVIAATLTTLGVLAFRHRDVVG